MGILSIFGNGKAKNLDDAGLSRKEIERKSRNPDFLNILSPMSIFIQME